MSESTTAAASISGMALASAWWRWRNWSKQGAARWVAKRLAAYADAEDAYDAIHTEALVARSRVYAAAMAKELALK